MARLQHQQKNGLMKLPPDLFKREAFPCLQPLHASKDKYVIVILKLDQ